MNLKSLFSLCNATPQCAVNARMQRKRSLHIFFLREMGKKKKDKRKSCDRERYVITSLTDLLLVLLLGSDCLMASSPGPQASPKATLNRGWYFWISNLTLKST